MPQVGLEPTIPVFERAKTVHALDRAATVIGNCSLTQLKNAAHQNKTSPGKIVTVRLLTCKCLRL
jgi:hypothetical protein